MRRIIVETDEGTGLDWVPSSVHVKFQEMERVRAGDHLIDGPYMMHRHSAGADVECGQALAY